MRLSPALARLLALPAPLAAAAAVVSTSSTSTALKTSSTSTAAAAAPTNGTYLAHARAGMQAMQTWYQSSSGLWSSEGWWNSANSLTMVADLAALDATFVPNATAIFSNTYRQVGSAPSMVKTRLPAGGFSTLYTSSATIARAADAADAAAALQRRVAASAPNWQVWVGDYYDDGGWWALAWIAAYDVTRNANYLALAQAIFDNYLVHAGPTNCGNGGVYWSTADSYVNAITNELYLSVAAHLARRAAPAKAKAYLAKAKAQWLWFQHSGMINPQHTINDGLTASCANNGQTVWTYNQGVILGALVELHAAAPAGLPGYLSNATQIATAAIAALADPTTLILHEPCEAAGCSGDDSQFKGIFVRNLQALQRAAPNPLFSKFILANANSIWANDRSPNNTFSVNWAGPNVPGDTASSTGSALDCLIAAAVITGH